jgi:hypothetical protein
MNEPIPEGKPGAGRKAADHFDMWLDEYYDYRGWNKKNGLQTMDCLRGLGLEDVAEVLLKEGVISKEKPVAREKMLKDQAQKAEEFKDRNRCTNS